MSYTFSQSKAKAWEPFQMSGLLALVASLCTLLSFLCAVFSTPSGSHFFSTVMSWQAQGDLLLSPNSTLKPTPRKAFNVSRFFLTHLSPVTFHQERCLSYTPLCYRDHNSCALHLLGASELLCISLVRLCFLCLTVELTYCEKFSGDFLDTINWLQRKPSTSLSLISVNYVFVVFFSERLGLAIQEYVSLKRYWRYKIEKNRIWTTSAQQNSQ